METCAAVDGSGCTGDTLQLGDNCAFAERINNVLSCHSGTGHIVGCDLAVNLNTVDGTVHRDDLHACGNCGLNRTCNSVGVDGVDNQNADTGSHQSLNIGGLLGCVVAGVGDLQVNAQLGSFSLCALNQGHKEGVILGRNSKTHGAIYLSGSGAFLAVDHDAAGCHGQHHCHSQKQCKYFFHGSLLPYLLRSDSTATRMTTALITS